MVTSSVEELYERHVKPLPAAERLRLVAMIAQDLVSQPAEKPKRSLLELEGLGAEIWQGIDAQEYVNELRKEWDHRP
ncbi:MAG: hypothetical protein A3F84_24015 [Candidatus Handelsmanbacteria bacterium RIFCSPLOWO2_12_FULL_64_10]|uniref:Addiction module protein n=1 Tax=Handelsmanbacteria sp. (strain RIFCSPLOWO2_12_FULL_64_10) TaxID=1817868 RepID=A0A1F6CHW9_HANXR|nr:MAG: hypothetical protein A3F84_24015 [Candidatus Handelsmanbacteria bacterium RIFCSPLOWO2_12_FULL_64_10]